MSSLFLDNLFNNSRSLHGKKVAVMFSGGLDTTFFTHFLTHSIGAQVTTVVAHVGSIFAGVSGERSPAYLQIRERSIELGAADHVELDAKASLAKLLESAILAEAQLYRGHHPASSLARVAISEKVVEFAKKTRQATICHGSNGSQNNPFRFHGALEFFARRDEAAIEVFAPNLETPVPRNLQVRYLEENHVRLPTTTFEQEVSQDDNALGFELEESHIKNPDRAYDPELVLAKIPEKSEEVQIGLEFKNGLPIAIQIGRDESWIPLSVWEILNRLNAVGAAYRIGIWDYPEPRPIGIQAREIHIAPGMSIIVRAHHLLRAHSFPPRLNRKLEELSRCWSEFVMALNLWSRPERGQMDEVFRLANETLSGQVVFRLRVRSLDMPRVTLAIYRGEGSRPPVTTAQVKGYFARLEDARVDLNKPPSPNSVSSKLDRLLYVLPRLIDIAYQNFETVP